MSIFKERVIKFDDCFSKDIIDMTLLRKLCFGGVPDLQSFRALSWSLMLGYLDPNTETWMLTHKKKRALYRQFIEELVLPPGLNNDDANIDDGGNGGASGGDGNGGASSGDGDGGASGGDGNGGASSGDGNGGASGGGDVQHDHPLSEGPESAWNTFFNDNEFLLQIDKDVRRLCPDMSFFQQATNFPCDIVVNSKGERRLHQRVVPSVLNSANVERKGLGMTKINHINKGSNESYAAMGEGQEAHWEVVQRILFIYAKLNPGQGYVQGMNEIVGPIYYVFASDSKLEFRQYAEADCFFCFTALMGEIRDFFIKTLDDAEGGIKCMMSRLENMLKEKDIEIHDHLKQQELHPQYYSFRWLTLLLSQEFPLPDVLRIWDSVLADEHRFDFLIKVCCAMILLQREKILENDFASNVKLLQNYPPIDINVLLRHATSLK